MFLLVGVTMNNKNIVLTVFVVLGVAVSLGCTETTLYQDEEWKNMVIDNNYLISSDLDNVAYALEDMDFDYMYSMGNRLSTDSRSMLEESRKYKVSPELQKAKEEYELALPDLDRAGEYAMDSANKLKSGNLNAGQIALQHCLNYINSGSDHIHNSMNEIKATSK